MSSGNAQRCVLIQGNYTALHVQRTRVSASLVNRLYTTTLSNRKGVTRGVVKLGWFKHSLLSRLLIG